MPSLTELKRQGYRAQRAASHGANITLVAGCGSYRATFECATRIAEVLGDRNLEDVGDGILEVIPSYKIPTEELCETLTQLSRRFSVALVEYLCDRSGGRFVCLWRINKAVEQTPPASTNLDDY